LVPDAGNLRFLDRPVLDNAAVNTAVQEARVPDAGNLRSRTGRRVKVPRFG